MRSTRFVAAAGAAIVLAALLAGCGSKKPAASTAASTEAGKTTTTFPTGPVKDGCVVLPSAPKMGPNNQKKPTTLLASGKHYDVTMKTNCGSFTFRIDQAQSPHASASFVDLVKAGFFDQTIFHRIAVGFVIQGGDPTGKGTSGPGYETVDTPPATATYTHGVVAMAKTSVAAPGTAGSQFFVVTAANAGLPPAYAIIGTVTKGLDVVDRIGKLGDTQQLPTMVVEIEKATVATSR
jgi:peptidyl-prolyl cis-trans isomerase B (cyclophilin B)